MNYRWILTLALLTSAIPVAGQELLIQENDQVVWLGATFLERMQHHGHLEALLTAQSSAPVTFRNLGWSGDEVTGISRALFGSAADGYKRMLSDLKISRPTVIVIQYGAVEAEAGKSGEATFSTRLGQLLDSLSATGARLVLLSPLHRTQPRKVLPDPRLYNAQLDRYCEILAEAATERSLPWIDIRDLLKQVESDDGLVPSAHGYWQIAPLLARRLGQYPLSWSVALDLSTQSYDAVETMLSDLKWEPTGVQFRALDRHIPAAGAQQGWIQANGLPPGTYELKADGRKLLTASHQQLARGVALAVRGGNPQTEQMRKKIVAKNLLFFHRHRPQNETYLFLFRKHEQGNNAVEVPQYDPLIQQAEGAIAELRSPRTQSYALTRTGP